ncbi:uncharacterized protein ATC70_004729 [Mucor velutinosus]|uniref:Uncharacterized protein n=1 Tax=Mucor velutinosus TaxID=708070 RepID=A0AAN7D5N6_9FUNG|nr:hypothetical protein ATC70_004729 [Mucor velutinosus]
MISSFPLLPFSMMKESSAPKAINIIRPSNQTTNVNNHPPQFVSKPSKIIASSKIHQRSSTFSLYDPKQHTATVQPLKKPMIELYKPGKYQLKMLTRPHILQKSEQMSNPTPPLPALPMPITDIVDQKQEDLSVPSDNEGAEDQAEVTQEEEEEQEEQEQEQEQERKEEEAKQQSTNNDSLPEARIHRKIADLEISNKSLLTINGMLELTVRHQAKQVASFKKRIMTIPDAEEQQEQQRREEIIRQAENEEDWENDEQFNRLKRMTEMLIEQAQNALTFQAQATGGRVITTGHHHRRRSSSTRRHKSTRSSNNETQQQ